MKKQLLTLGTIATCLVANAQVVVDSVSLQPGYPDQVYYSLDAGEVERNIQADWDLAFDVSGFGSSLHMNAVKGNRLFEVPMDTSHFSSLDTMGMSAWVERHNSDTSWSLGAFDQGGDGGFNLGWGTYSQITHIVTGTKFYVAEMLDGTIYKVWIQKLQGGTYTFRYATLDNSIDQVATITKADYTDKNFVYFNLTSETVIDNEPAHTSWDLLFTRYTGYVPIPYPVSGVLQNNGVTVAEATEVADVESYQNYANETFESKINTIGHDWKSFQGFWALEDSLVYFVETRAGDIWKLIFTDFGGSTTGKFYFTKERIAISSVLENEAVSIFEVYPNPTTEQLNVVLNNTEAAQAKIYSLTGQLMSETNITGTGLNTQQIQVSDLPAGTYLLSVQTANANTTKTFIKY